MSPIKNPEQLKTPTPSVRERIASGELHFMGVNYDHTLNDYRDVAQQNETVKKLRQQYGVDGVVLSNAMVNGEPTGKPESVGVYVDAQKWAKLHPEQKQ